MVNSKLISRKVLKWTLGLINRNFLNIVSAHPNCILFITHGGVISKIEAVHFGVPTIGIPVYGDQFANVESSVIKGISIKVDISEYLARNIKNAIVEMLSVPRYATCNSLHNPLSLLPP